MLFFRIIFSSNNIKCKCTIHVTQERLCSIYYVIFYVKQDILNTNQTWARRWKWPSRKNYLFFWGGKNYLNKIFFLKIFLLVMSKYWGKQIFTHGIFPEVGQKQKTERKERKKDWTMVITMAKLRMAHASTHGARKPPGVAHAKLPGPKFSDLPITF